MRVFVPHCAKPLPPRRRDKTGPVEPFSILGNWAASRVVGSSPRLLRELEFVGGSLKVGEGYNYPADDPLVTVKAAYLQLQEVAGRQRA